MNRSRKEMIEEHKVAIIEGNGSPLLSRKTGRNDKCRCGSSRKAKDCCGAKTDYFHSRKTPHN